MPQVPPVCPATGQPTSKDYIHTFDGNFVDNGGRTLLLRGVNLSGSSKAPVNQPSQVLDGFWDTAEAGGESFIGRPLNLDDGSADEHLKRLRGWGFNMLRFPVTWEALEHEGPGKYDYAFMDYTIRVLRKCKEYGFKVFLNPHQDTWSRFSGGSGAPYWTLLACGLNPQAFTATQAAIIHCEYPTPAPDSRDPASLPAMIWSTNYGRLISQTLFALFFGGKTFAPKCIIDGVNIQDYLQSHFARAFGVLAERVRDAGGLLDEVVIGWDSMNEPAEGFLGYEDLNVYPQAQGSTLKKGTVPTPIQSFKLAMGVAQTVDNYSFGSFGPKRNGSVTIDPKGIRIWADPSTEPGGIHPKWGWTRGPEWTLGTCLWALHGVWDIRTGYVLQPEYFRYLPAPTSTSGWSNPPTARTEVCFLQDFFLPQLTLYFKHIRAAHPGAIAFVQPPVFAIPPQIPESLLKGRACYSTHYYDGLTLVTRHWNWFNADALGLLRGKYSSPIMAVKIGESAIRSSLQSQLGILKEDAVNLGAVLDSGSSEPPVSPNRYPTIIGEIGTPYDMDDKKAYDRSSKSYGDYSSQERALDASLNAADGPNALNYTVWTYCPDNCHMWGDGWNMEDLSLWSGDDLSGVGKSSTSGPVGVAGSIAPARASSLTLSTLPVPSSPYAPSSYTAKPQPSHDLLAFLRDGARAVRAFCRPWPVKVVGTPADIKFDIGKASLRVAIHVGPADAPKVDEEDEAFGPTPTKSNDEESLLPTEIFLPLIHFASDACVGQSLVPLTEREQKAESEDEPHSGSGSTSTSGATTPRYTASTLTLPLTASVKLSKGDTSVIKTEAYDFEVKVSEGRVEMRENEQMLRWFYAVPSGAEKEKEVWIEIKRSGGAIKYAKLAAGVSGARKAREGCVGWLEGLCGEESEGWCPQGCSVM
ncbi:glycoside hydrolase family 5 protein [Hydnomerulius pinastri MD-312]|uniref:Glycoside hydrolase family 5 protein n=1 Tax=Hydnomerulius pinastri MD-312 TaxID=994086 RepID=A0A0C9VYI3_9AGAM|nr:glycoside hydrolase family 5 protein [Hydnomerulius pinastri MD-312]